MKRLRLSHPQKRIWFAEKEHARTSVNNFGIHRVCPQGTSIEELTKAWNLLLSKADAFRLRIHEGSVEGDFLPVSQSVVEFEPENVRVQEFESESELAKWCEAEVRKPFFEYGQKLYEFTAIRLGDSLSYYLKVHHIISDGWSIELSWRFIEMALSGKELPEVPYSTFLELEREYLDSEAFRDDEEFWLDQMKVGPEPLQLGDGSDDAPFQDRFVIEGDLLEEAHKFAAEHRLSLFKQFSAVLSAVCCRLARLDHFCCGFANHNRFDKSLHSLCGMLVSTLPLVVEYRPDTSFLQHCKEQADWLNRVIKTRSKYPFDLLVPKARQAHDVELANLLNFSVAGHPDEKDAPPLTVGDTQAGLTNHFNLSRKSNDGELEIAFFGDGKEYSSKDAERLFKALKCAWQGALQAPQSAISKLPLIDEDDWKEQLSFNSSFVPYPEQSNVVAQLQQQRDKWSDRLAVKAGADELTWQELWDWSDQIAAELLQRRNVDDLAGEFVGVCLRRDVSLVPSLIGILKSGGAYLPLDPEYPSERLEFMSEDAGLKLALCHKEFHDVLGQLQTVDPSDVAKTGDPLTPPAISPDSKAYAIYTSGTTGKPKGVPIRHHQLVHLGQAISKPFQIDDQSVCLLFASLNFDASVVEIFAPLLRGATLVVANEEARSDGQILMEILRGEKVTFATIPPALLAILPAIELPHLSTLVVAGESTDPSVIARWSQGRRMVNAYGPTENTVAISAGAFDSADSAHDIGPPLDNVHCYVLDQGGQPLPIGIPGELYAAGLQVSSGYLHRPELNAERFLPNPYASPDLRNPRMYKTGDLVKWLENGHLEFIGRVDFQVKIRGHRIECGEVGVALAALDGVESCLVKAIPQGSTHRLVAYLLAEDGQQLSTQSLRSQAEKILPDYMVPSAFLVLDEFPRTPTGKIDRRALPVPDSLEELSETEYVAPTTGHQKILCELWAELLGVPKVGILDNFYSLGGDSLLSMRLQALAQERGLHFSLTQLKENPTVQGLAKMVDEKASPDTLPPLERQESSGSYPLPRNALMMQRQEETLESTGIEPHLLASWWALRGELDADRMLQAMDKFCQRHEIFRVNLNGDVVTPIDEVPNHTCVELSEDELSDFVVRQSNAEANELPSCRLRLVKTGPQEHRLYSFVTHQLMDAWSTGIMQKELAALYAGEDLTAAYQLRDFSDWYHELLDGYIWKESREYWKGQLGGYEPPKGKDPEAEKTSAFYKAQPFFLPLPADALRSFEAACKKEGSTLFEGLYTIYHLTLVEIFGRDTVMTGYVTALREGQALQGMLASLTNRMYLRTEFAASANFSQALGEVSQKLSEHREHRWWPAWEIRDERGDGFPGYFFHYVPRPQKQEELFSNITTEAGPPPNLGYWPLPVAFTVLDHDTRPALSILSQSGFIDSADAMRILESFSKLLLKI